MAIDADLAEQVLAAEVEGPRVADFLHEAELAAEGEGKATILRLATEDRSVRGAADGEESLAFRKLDELGRITPGVRNEVWMFQTGQAPPNSASVKVVELKRLVTFPALSIRRKKNGTPVAFLR